MAASDLSLAFDGEIVAENAAMQLPTIILNNMSHAQAYFTLLYNSFENFLNISIQGEA